LQTAVDELKDPARRLAKAQDTIKDDSRKLADDIKKFEAQLPQNPLDPKASEAVQRASNNMQNAKNSLDNAANKAPQSGAPKEGETGAPKPGPDSKSGEGKPSSGGKSGEGKPDDSGKKNDAGKPDTSPTPPKDDANKSGSDKAKSDAEKHEEKALSELDKALNALDDLAGKASKETEDHKADALKRQQPDQLAARENVEKLQAKLKEFEDKTGTDKAKKASQSNQNASKSSRKPPLSKARATRTARSRHRSNPKKN